MRRLGTVLCGLALALAACGGDEAGPGAESTPAPTAPPAAPTATPAAGESSAANAYIGSIAVDPADGTVFLGTGLGLYRLEGREAQRVTGTLEGEGTISSNLVVRFAGPDELLASGHPEGDGPLPENLGLMRSNDGGRTWQPVSAVGRDDYHLLQAAGRHVVAVRAEEADVLVSDDGGRSFETRTPPAPPVDVGMDPRDPARLAVATAEGLFTSGDAGGSWRPREPVADAQLAWGEELYRADPGGAVHASGDGGQTWEERGSAGISVTELAVDDGGTLYAGVPGGEVHTSTDRGRTWKRLIRLR